MLQKIKSKFGYPESEKNQTEKEKKNAYQGVWRVRGSPKVGEKFMHLLCDVGLQFLVDGSGRI